MKYTFRNAQTEIFFVNQYFLIWKKQPYEKATKALLSRLRSALSEQSWKLVSVKENKVKLAILARAVKQVLKLRPISENTFLVQYGPELHYLSVFWYTV